MKNKISNLDDITSLDEAKEYISILLESQRAALNFITLYDFDLKTHLITIRGYSKLMQENKNLDEIPIFAKIIEGSAKRASKLTDLVYRAAGDEFARLENPQNQELELENVDLKSILFEGIEKIREVIDFQSKAHNESRNNMEGFSYLEFNEESKELQEAKIAREEWKPFQIHLDVSDDLPTAQFKIESLKDIITSIAEFITFQATPNGGLAVQTSFDQKTIQTTFSFQTYEPNYNELLLKDFQNFEAASTIFEFNPLSLYLYRAWTLLKMCDGNLIYNIQNNNVIITITFRRRIQ